MPDVEAKITINRNIEKVFAFIAENENDPQWCIPVVETKRIAGSKPGKGSRYTFASQQGPMIFRGEFETTGFVPPHRIEWRGDSSIAKFSGYYSLEGGEDVTNLTEAAKVQFKGIMRLFQGILSSQFGRTYEMQLQKLKQILENGAG